jgi:hypothetical protein
VVVRLEGTNVDQGKRILKVNAKFDYDIQSCKFICLQSWMFNLNCDGNLFCPLIYAGEWNGTNHSRRFG